MTTLPAALRLGAVELTVRDLDRAIAWYQQVLGLHVGDIGEGLRFYRDVLGFEVQADLGSAAFVSAGGYHHHLGFNIWNGHGAGPPPEHRAGCATGP